MPNNCTSAQYRSLRGTALLISALCASVATGAQPSRPPVPSVEAPEAGVALAPVLRDLVDGALRYNLELAAAGAGIEQRLAALDQARARYWPVLDLNARYSVANGGRTIDVPVGDLVNPIYGALARLQPGTRYPTVANQQIPFLQRQGIPHEPQLTIPPPNPEHGGNHVQILHIQRFGGPANREVGLSPTPPELLQQGRVHHGEREEHAVLHRHGGSGD